MDNATSLAESSAAHESYSEGDEDEKLRVKKIAISSPTAAAAASATATHRPVLQRQNTSRATFFVCEDSDEDEDEAEAAEESLFRSRIALARRNNSNTNIKHQPCQQVQKSQLPLKFYVEDEEDELDGADGDNEHEEDQDEEEEEEESYFSLKVSEFVPVVDRRRKLSSLLSDLLMAEKQLQLQQLSITSTSGPTSTTIRTTRNSTDMDCSSCLSNHESVPGSPCPSTTNSDGEMAIHQNDQRLFRTSSSPKHLDNLQQEPNRVSPPPSSAYALITENQKPKSPLVRTKRVFKNLDELAIITAATNNNSNATASTTPSTNCTVSSPIPLPSPLSPTASFKAPATTNTNTTTTKAAAPNPSAGWTRASLQVPQQVHVQIQNLVVQSTSTAHRAFRSASSTLNEVLFRTAK
ncbi:hypothetical protein BGZ83_006765 [Gryganskiella cystojenkinii]|nr:hypothetical protein BGZ83_006765 [Gryganskiella cystojenkinii]